MRDDVDFGCSLAELWDSINKRKHPWDPSLWVWMLDLGVVTA